MYTGDQFSNTVSVVDPADHKLLGVIRLGDAKAGKTGPLVSELLTIGEIRTPLNRALTGIPPERVRYHICWGSQNMPHTTDVPLKELVGLLFKANVGAHSIEAANPRHEHEWRM